MNESSIASDASRVPLPGAGSLELAPLEAALGTPGRVAYAARHVYPMGAPAFTPSPRAERERLAHDVLRLYVHVPFCNYGCTFCFYAKRIGARRDQMERYVAGLERELGWIEPGTPLLQLFMGGGTPTALPPDLLERLLTSIFERAPSHGSQVHTVEASPESITPEHVRVLRACGIERVSMGIQSLDDAVLSGVHRRHSPEQALASCRLLLDEGMILNIDLIYGLPGQTEASFERDLEAVASAGVHSVTLYDLRVNEQTPVAKAVGHEESLGLARLVRWRAFVKHAAQQLGLEQTRWHTFRRPDAVAARHQRAPCFDDTARGFQLGVGMSARSHLGYAIYRNHEDFETYLGRVETGESPVEELFWLAEDDRKTQFVARTLGDGKALDRQAYRAAFGHALEEDFGGHLQRLHAGGLIEDAGQQIWLSECGKLVYDLVTLSFYPQHARQWLDGREHLLKRRRAG